MVVVLGLVIVVLSYLLIVFENNSSLENASLAEENYMISSMKRCYKDGNRKDCLQKMAKDLAGRFSIKEILAVFAKHEREEEFFTICHEASHYLGQEAYKRVDSVAKVYEQSDETCIGGVFHGAIEGYFIKKNLSLQESNMPRIAEEVSHVCDEAHSYENEQSVPRCSHGLGHALLYVVNDDLRSALTLCDNLQTTRHRVGCYTGVLMQNVSNYGSFDHPNAMIKEEDPLYPCPVLDEIYQRTCYTYAVLLRYQGNADKAIEICGMIPKPLRAECFMTFGRDGTLFSDNLGVLKDRCAAIEDNEYYGACVSGLAGQLVVRYGVEATLPFEFCAVISEGSRNKCYSEIGFRAKSIASQNEIIRFCNKMPEVLYRISCIKNYSNP